MKIKLLTNNQSGYAEVAEYDLSELVGHIDVVTIDTRDAEPDVRFTADYHQQPVYHVKAAKHEAVKEDLADIGHAPHGQDILTESEGHILHLEHGPECETDQQFRARVRANDLGVRERFSARRQPYQGN